MTRTVRALRRAESDLVEIRRYLEREAPDRAAVVIDELLDAIDGLVGPLPHKGPMPRDARLRTLGFRYLSVGRYLIFYKPMAKQIRVYRVLHEKRSCEALDDKPN